MFVFFHFEDFRLLANRNLKFPHGVILLTDLEEVHNSFLVVRELR